jgi:3',5'-nucleoside bisphosphate phosphatase
VVRRAAAAGLTALALTDHDTVAGMGAAASALPGGITLVPGMELSCRRNGRSVHMLAYLFDPDYAELAAECAAIRRSRVRRARQMVDKLIALGVPVSWEQVRSIAGDGVVGRPHVARAMIEAGVVKSVPEAFTDSWIGPGGPAYVPRYALDPVRAVALVRAAGGATALAHPLVGNRGNGPLTEVLIAELAAAGLAGIEVAHPDHDQVQRARLEELAAELGLACTGGSDDHGALTGDRIGSEWTGLADLERLLAGATGAPVITW